MSTTKNGVASKLTHSKEEDITKGEVSKTPLSNLDMRLEILENGHSVITEVRSRDEKGKGNTQL
jgi:ActR/RegA family two-component response regulator